MQFVMKPVLNQQARQPCAGPSLMNSLDRISPYSLDCTRMTLRPFSCRKYRLSNLGYNQSFSRVRSSDHYPKLRFYVTTGNDSTSKRSDRALIDELHRLSHLQENSQPTLGPFLMPRGKIDEKPLRRDEIDHWSQVSWSERSRRVIRMARNLIIVGFGGCLGILVIYSITSELFAPSSTTNLINMVITTLENSDKLKRILKPPLKFHTSTIPSQSIQNQTGIIELRFWVESYKPNHTIEGDWKTIEWWKNWITPLITSQVFSPSHSNLGQNLSIESNSNASRNKIDQSSNSGSTPWWPGLLKLIMPTTFGAKSSRSSTDQSSWSDRFFSNHSSFEQGEVIAELIKDSKGHWKFKTLVVDFPDSQNLKYQLDVSDELRRRKKVSKRNEGEGEQDTQQNPGRLRFWNRRISA